MNCLCCFKWKQGPPRSNKGSDPDEEYDSIKVFVADVTADAVKKVSRDQFYSYSSMSDDVFQEGEIVTQMMDIQLGDDDSVEEEQSQDHPPGERPEEPVNRQRISQILDMGIYQAGIHASVSSVVSSEFESESGISMASSSVARISSRGGIGAERFTNFKVSTVSSPVLSKRSKAKMSVRRGNSMSKLHGFEEDSFVSSEEISTDYLGNII